MSKVGAASRVAEHQQQKKMTSVDVVEEVEEEEEDVEGSIDERARAISLLLSQTHARPPPAELNDTSSRGTDRGNEGHSTTPSIPSVPHSECHSKTPAASAFEILLNDEKKGTERTGLVLKAGRETDDNSSNDTSTTRYHVQYNGGPPPPSFSAASGSGRSPFDVSVGPFPLCHKEPFPPPPQRCTLIAPRSATAQRNLLEVFAQRQRDACPYLTPIASLRSLAPVQLAPLTSVSDGQLGDAHGRAEEERHPLALTFAPSSQLLRLRSQEDTLALSDVSNASELNELRCVSVAQSVAAPSSELLQRLVDAKPMSLPIRERQLQEKLHAAHSGRAGGVALDEAAAGTTGAAAAAAAAEAGYVAGHGGPFHEGEAACLAQCVLRALLYLHLAGECFIFH